MNIVKTVLYSIALPLIFCFLLVQCKHIVANWGGGPIDRFGEYRMLNNRVVIFVSKKNNVLQYIVENQAGDTIIQTHENSSIFQRWMLFWDKKDNFWVSSSDIGNFVWKKNDQGVYIKMDLSHNSSMRNDVPIELRHFY